ncbi:MAG: LysR family transcriptional regulator [Oleispira sp.]|nr:LysR family transcriptional regulator [Oleispira sp.]MBL4880007.1 LysR family transcriptional regulator [Oleispira sp.]
MASMSKIDYLNIDGNSITTFLTVLEENSVSKAAIKLKVTQSAISHTLDKLRQAFNDPLFVRNGRGIAPTARSKALEIPLRSIISNLKMLSFSREFDPSNHELEFTIAVNDFLSKEILPIVMKQFYKDGLDVKLNIIQSGLPGHSSVRSLTSHCQLLVTPSPPEGKGFIKKELFKSKMVCYYDSNVRNPPLTLEEYADCKYIDVRFSDTEEAMMIEPAIDRTALGSPTVTVPSFGELSDFIQGTKLITTQIEAMHELMFKELSLSPLPFEVGIASVYLVWHEHSKDDPQLQWLINRIIDSIPITNGCG